MEEIEQKKTGPYARYGGKYTMLFRGGHRANHRRLPDVTKMKWDELGTGNKKKDRYDQYVDDDSEEEEQAEKKEANEEVNFDLTQDMPSFDRNTRYSHPSVDQPYRPFQYKRGARTKNHVDRYFMKNKRYESPFLNDDETRVFIPNHRKGMIIGRRHTNRVEIEEMFDVTLKIAMGECDDKSTPVIIIGSSAANRAACKEHIEAIIRGVFRKPPTKEVESSSSSSEDESEEEIEDETPERQTTTDSDGERLEERARPTKQHIRKILYKEISSVRKRDATEITEWRRDSNDIKVSFMSKHENKREYKPCLTFKEAFWGFPRILDHLEKQKFDKPSPIQSQLWPIALSGRDTIGISQTGSGKTLAFLAPLVAHCLYGGVLTHPDVGSTIKEEEDGDTEGDTSGTDQEQIEERLEFNMQIRMDYEAGEPMGLIIAPTRELANQIKEQVEQVFGILEKTSYSSRDGPNTKFLVGKDNKRPMTTMLAVGGTDRREDITRLQDGSPPTIVIGTPGRLMDLSDMGELKLHKCSYVVLDEADKMLDQDFRGDIEKLIDQSNIPKKRQIIMTSATWPVEIQKFAKQYMSKALKIIVGKFDLTCVKTVVQSVIKVGSDNEKFRELCKYIDELRNDGEKVTDVDSDSDDEIVIVAGGDNRNQRIAPPVNNERADSPGPRLEGDSSSDTDQGGYFGSAQLGKLGKFRIGLVFGWQSKGNLSGNSGKLGMIGHFGGLGKLGISGISAYWGLGILEIYPPIRLTNKPLHRHAPTQHILENFFVHDTSFRRDSGLF